MALYSKTRILNFILFFFFLSRSRGGVGVEGGVGMRMRVSIRGKRKTNQREGKTP